jgi:hypothetical protein
MRLRIRGMIGVLGLVLAWPGAALAQQVVEERLLALQWIRGEYRAPLICVLDGVHHQALRRLLVRPAPKKLGRPLASLTFFDLDAPPETPCTAVTGGDAPNILGTLILDSDARTDEDTGMHDFKTNLAREGGYEYRIESGRLKLVPTEPAEPDARIVDFARGTARFYKVNPGADAYRRLVDFVPRRMLTLELEARDGTRLAFDLVQFDVR